MTAPNSIDCSESTRLPGGIAGWPGSRKGTKSRQGHDPARLLSRLALTLVSVGLLVLVGCHKPESTPVKKPTGRQGRLKALLVGINDLPTGQHQRKTGPALALEYAEADATALARLLQVGYQVPADDLSILVGKAANHARITRAIRSHFADLKPGETGLFYFSGHGTTLPDKDGDEKDGYDEGLVTADPPTRDGATVTLLDDFIHREFLTSLSTRGARAVLILDCCHSAAINRDGDTARIKGFGKWNHCPSMESKAPTYPQNTVALFACRADQEAREDGGHGLFTGFLLQELAGGAALTYSDLIQRVRGRVRNCDDPHNRKQFPLAMGNSEMVVFRYPGATLRPRTLVLETWDDGSCGTIDRGDGDSVWFFPGQKLELQRLDPGTFTFHRIGLAEVTSTCGLKSLITASPGILKPGLLALPTRKPDHPSPLKINLQGLSPTATTAATKWLADQPGYRIVPTNQKARFTLCTVKGRLRVQEGPAKNLLDGHRNWRVLLTDILTWHRWVTSTVKRNSDVLEYHIDLRVTGEQGKKIWQEARPDKNGEYRFQINDRIRLRATLARKTKEPWFCYPLCLNNSYDFQLPDDWPCTRLWPDTTMEEEFDVNGPPGMDRLYLFLSPDPNLADRFPNSLTRLRGEPPPAIDPTRTLTLDRISIRVSE